MPGYNDLGSIPLPDPGISFRTPGKATRAVSAKKAGYFFTPQNREQHFNF